ncbi:MAG: dephospho-CoA kinase [Bryobacteraceae bacterium]|jgi:dephospho-CoA kinase
MLKVGLTGGLASGKTFVGEELARLGCLLIQADELGHEVLSPGGEAYAAVVAEFGAEILSAEGGIDRGRLAAEVFRTPERLARLNALVHPPVLEREEELMARFRQDRPDGIAIVEAAILIEAGRYKDFDRMILVYCRPEQQLERALRRPGATEADVRARLARQMPLEEKKKYANFAIDTSGDKEDTLRQTRAVWEALANGRQAARPKRVEPKCIKPKCIKPKCIKKAEP